MSVKQGAKLLLLDADNQALVLRRSDTHPHIPLTPDLPGGEIEEGETPATAACRETFEETGIKIKEDDIEHIGSRQYGAFGRQYDLHLFVTRVKERPAVTISWEHDAYDWKSVFEIHDLDDGFQSMLDDFAKTIKA